MPTLTAFPRALAAAVERGLALPTEPSPAAPNKKRLKATEFLQHQRQAREHLLPLLTECFPEAFMLPARPLAVGIHKAILDVAGEEIDPHELGVFLKYWVSRWSYLRAVHVGAPRINLDGSVAGVPTIKQRNAAGRALWGERYQEIKEVEVEEVT